MDSMERLMQIEVDENSFSQFLYVNIGEDKLYELINNFELTEEDWMLISQYQAISLDFITKFIEKIDTYALELNEFIPGELLEEALILKRFRIFNFHSLDEYALRHIIEKGLDDVIFWTVIAEKQQLSSQFLRDYADKLDWDAVVINQTLNEKDLIEFKNRLNWVMVSKFQELPEYIIEKFHDKVDWETISLYQKLSEEFIIKHNDRLNLQKVYKGISGEYISDSLKLLFQSQGILEG